MAETIINSFSQVKHGQRLTYILDRRNQLTITDPKEDTMRAFQANYVFFGAYKHLNTPVIPRGTFDYGVWAFTREDHKEFTDEEYEGLLV